jgi:hypothetical protein
VNSKINQSVSFIWVYALLCAVGLLGAFAIGCGDEKKKEKKEDNKQEDKETPSTGTQETTSTGDAQAKSPDGSSASATESGDDKSDESAGFLTAKDFPKGTQSLTSEIVKSEISNQLAYIAIPIRNESSKSGTSCLDPLFKTKWTGDAKSISFEFSKKMDCKKAGESTKNDQEMDVKIKYTCQKDAFASIVGKTLKEVGGLNWLKQCKTSKATFQFNLTSTSAFISAKDPKVTIDYSDKSAFSTAKGTPCMITTTATTMEFAADCQYFKHSTSVAADGKPTKTTLIGSFKDAKGPLDTNKPFKTGSFVFSINNWKGSLTFDATLTPAFEASSGSTKVRGKIPASED